MSIIERAAAALGHAVVPQDICDELLEQACEAEELRCDLDRLTSNAVDHAVAAGLRAR